MDFSKAKILCLGDIMLDKFAYCDTERISPEAPVPVLLLKRTQSMLGGAGNVARNIASLGGQAVLLGLLGTDEAGAEVRALVDATPGLTDAHVASPNRPTIRKTRYMAAHQQLVRIDEEQLHPLDPVEAAGLIAAVEKALPEVNALILSDYGKSVVCPQVIDAAIARARALAVPVFVDPKTDDFGRYRGATCITPNLKELGVAARLPVGTDAEIVAAARKLMAEAEAAAILTTRSEKGMVLVETTGEVHFEASRAQEVYDVSGAGDTVIAVLALASASGHPLPQAMHLANRAAGIVVSKLGTATVELDELMLDLSRDVTDKDWHHIKYYSADEAETLVRRWKDRGLKVGFTNGCFDIVHAGHVSLLAASRAQCDRLLVALNTDRGVRRLKGPNRPVNSLADRTAVIAAVESVDAVISFDEETPIELIRRLKPDVLVKGGDYTIEGVVGADIVQANGGKVLLVDLVEGRSTTRLIDAIRGSSAA
ncbi:MAG TPA: bifunctional D-glycero-beta-D-manno-heptose-7-phosphate kinase/D-glycero-beta-D-manno-heptose 1-phosphate adenylyltransferase HldE [Stellaceae bacterium]|jgi:D-beta-D-heptose 7-phosphate kinase/D-beta-D-heptose 1-phosphate adenosyltransferase|nr:bifunctional D-glycero-beta-D-manno-heptose-7-phosphate kinase/D-glycero-beta-D-manno-heptose 1-phosphate adenylyltransferase HldE [Stellaceae bacterium]